MPDDSWAVGDLVPAAGPAPGASVTSSGRRIWQGLIPGQLVGGYRLHEPSRIASGPCVWISNTWSFGAGRGPSVPVAPAFTTTW